MQKGRSMGMVVLAAIAVIALIGSVFIFVRSEDNANTALMSRLSDLESAVARLDRSMIKNSDMAEIEDSMARMESELNAAKEAIAVYRDVVKNYKPAEFDQKKPVFVHLVNPVIAKPKPTTGKKK